MGFQSGQVSFGRLGIEHPPVVGGAIDGEVLDRLGQHTLKPTTVGAPPEVEAGWCAGAHVFDERFAYEKNIYAGGAVAWMAARIDTNRVPSEIKRAIRSREFAAALAESGGGFLSRSDKRDVRDAVERAIHEELASGRHRNSKMVELHWDSPSATLLTASAAGSTVEQLGHLWRRTFDGSNLRPLGSGALAEVLIGPDKGSRFFEDLSPTAFTPPPASARSEDDSPRDRDTPEVPWTTGSEERHDFLGNEFLLWLWHAWDTGRGMSGGRLTVPAGAAPGGSGPLAVGMVLDRQVELECAWGITGKVSLRASPEGSSPLRSPEAFDALATGKWPRRIGLMLSDDVSQWSLTLQADRWLVSGCALPEPPEDVEFEGQRDAAEWRIEQIRRLDELLTALFGAFCKERSSSGWKERAGEIRKWIREHRPHRPPHPPQRNETATDGPAMVEPKAEPSAPARDDTPARSADTANDAAEAPPFEVATNN